MMRRILGNYPGIFMLEELHFFEQMWSSADRDRVIGREEAARLASRLLFIQRDGYLSKMQGEKYLEEGKKIVADMEDPVFPHAVLGQFCFYEAEKHGREIPCEKTPQDVFYLGEILSLFPSALIINMVRDPRGVMLSQKRKWQRRSMGATFMTRREQRRLRINYHPVTISRLWNASVRAAAKFRDDARVYTVHFEKLVQDPEEETKKLCAFLGIPFSGSLLQIPQVGSSHEADQPDALGIKAARAGSWESGNLNNGEIRICQRICGGYMEQYGYPLKKVRAGLLPLYYYISFPVKICLALLFNLHRAKNIVEAIKRRMS